VETQPTGFKDASLRARGWRELQSQLRLIAVVIMDDRATQTQAGQCYLSSSRDCLLPGSGRGHLNATHGSGAWMYCQAPLFFSAFALALALEGEIKARRLAISRR